MSIETQYTSDAILRCIQRQISLSPRSRGLHLITQEILDKVPEIDSIKHGVAHVFIQHTSASLTITENADPDVAQDIEVHLSKMAPDGAAHYTHVAEGPDDMSAHIKSCLFGSSVQIPITNGRPAFGIWQGIFLCEHRDSATDRSLVVTLWGET